MKAAGIMENIWKEGVKSLEILRESYLSTAD